MSLPINAFDRILALGNSKTDGTTTTSPPTTFKWCTRLFERIRAEKFTDGDGFDIGAPSLIQSGVASDTVTAVNAAIATRVTPWSPDAIIVELGTNDVTSGIVLATFQTQVNNLLTTLQNPLTYQNGRAPRWILWVGPNMIGEKFPDGANPFDTSPPAVDVNHTINDKTPILAARCAAFSVPFWNPRATVVAWETTYNLGNSGSGLLTTSADGGTGKHEVALGAEAMAGWMLDSSFQGIPASGLPASPLFSFFRADGSQIP